MAGQPPGYGCLCEFRSMNPGASLLVAVFVLPFLEPRHLNGFEDFLIRPVRLTLEVFQIKDPFVHVSESHGQRIQRVIFFKQQFGNFPIVSPLQSHDSPQETHSDAGTRRTSRRFRHWRSHSSRLIRVGPAPGASSYPEIKRAAWSSRSSSALGPVGNGVPLISAVRSWRKTLPSDAATSTTRPLPVSTALWQ